jgi:hypothetical protein
VTSEVDAAVNPDDLPPVLRVIEWNRVAGIERVTGIPEEVGDALSFVNRGDRPIQDQVVVE